MSNIAIIEYQTPGGNWVRVCDCSSHPANIKMVMDANFKSNPSYKKMRALDSKTKQLIDIAYR